MFVFTVGSGGSQHGQQSEKCRTDIGRMQAGMRGPMFVRCHVHTHRHHTHRLGTTHRDMAHPPRASRAAPRTAPPPWRPWCRCRPRSAQLRSRSPRKQNVGHSGASGCADSQTWLRALQDLGILLCGRSNRCQRIITWGCAQHATLRPAAVNKRRGPDGT